MTRDLTRWNRAGLSRFTYVDANAVTLLDRLRSEMLQRFGAEWDPAPPKATDMLERYGAVPHGDAGWELMRALARATHIVCAHVDAYANEAFLRTATQSESLRRLVALLDYHPAPASSASTTLAFDTKSDATGPITVPVGTSVRYQPPDGAPVVFETLLPLDAVLALSRLRVVNADANPDQLASRFTLETDVPLVTGDPLVLAEGSKRFVGRISAVARDPSGLPVVSVSPSPKGRGFTVGRTTVYTDPKDRLAVTGPTEQTVSSTSDGWLRLARTVTGIRKGDVVWITGGASLQFRTVTEVGAFAIRLDQPVSNLPLTATVGAALPVEVDSGTSRSVVTAAGDWTWLRNRTVGVGTRKPPGSGGGGGSGELGQMYVSAQIYYTVAYIHGDPESAIRPVVVDPAQLSSARVSPATYVGSAAASSTANKTTITLSPSPLFDVEYLFVQPDTAASSGLQVEAPLQRSEGVMTPTLSTSEVAKTEVGDWVVLAGESGDLVGRAVSVNAGPGPKATVSVDSWTGQMYPMAEAFNPATTRAYGHFNAKSRIAAWNRNDTELDGATTVQLDAVPAELIAGRPVIVEDAPPPEDVSAAPSAPSSADSSSSASASSLADSSSAAAVPTAVATRVLAVSRTAGATIPGPASVTFADPVPPHATVGSLLVHGNAVVAGHGRTMPTAVVGSGSADRVNQRFTVPATDVSTVPDPSFPSGVRLDAELTVDGRRWQQVATLRDAEPDAFAFTARLGDDGRPELLTGDGVNGRRVPTGRDNVIGSWRVGSGVVGILPAGSLAELVRPINGIDTVSQPLASSGGGSGDSADAIRDNAPRSVLALERAVSLADYEALAAGRADVWQARARQHPHAQRGASVELVVVPAGAGALSVAQAQAIRTTLEAAAPPATSVAVRGHRTVPLELSITIAVKFDAYDPERVRRDTLARVIDRVSAEARRLGQSITREEVVMVAEQIDGVENASCRIGESTALAAGGAAAVVRDAGNAIRLVRAEPDQLISVDPTAPAVSVVPQEYRL